jgi:chemotaxis response regulator CheB
MVDGEPPMPIRVMLSELPPLIHEIVARAISTAPDMMLVGSCVASSDALLAIASARPDVVIVPVAAAGVAHTYRAAAAAMPQVRVLEIDEQGLDLFELRLVTRDPNVGAMLGSIRDVAARIC